ncbi:hypothetical protein niasHT_006310 [Heterodera trifolii]|uniref:Uncharacterized protein n=1 Tax=Heterodera trifolii TaxID=157864 RepID=A0ABD2LTT3_9BILA
MDEWRKRRYDIQQRQPVVRDLLAEAAAAPLPESDEDDDYMLESGFALPAPSQYYGDLPVLPDNADAIEEMDTAQHRIATRRSYIMMMMICNIKNTGSTILLPLLDHPHLVRQQKLNHRGTLLHRVLPSRENHNHHSTHGHPLSRQAGYNPPAEPKHEKKTVKKATSSRRALSYSEKRAKNCLKHCRGSNLLLLLQPFEIPPVPPPRRGTKRPLPREWLRMMSTRPSQDHQHLHKAMNKQHRELFAIPSNQLTMTQRVERVVHQMQPFMRIAWAFEEIQLTPQTASRWRIANLRMSEKMELINTTLDKLYNDPSSPAAFAGVTALWKEARKKVRFPRAKTVAAGFMTDVQVDLADFQALSRHNRGHRYLLVAVDVLFKTPVCCSTQKNKRAEEMLEAFKELVEQMPMEFFEEQEIEKHEPVHSSVKASVAERAIRNVKQRLYRYFAESETLNWVDVVQQIVDGINNTPSRVHGMRPIDVNFENAQKKPRFHKDDFVRMSREKGQFEKGYLPNYGDEILEIDEVLKAVRPIRYKLRDDRGEKFRGTFYEQKLARVRKDADTSYRIEKVYKKRRKPDGSTEMLVKFIGYPEREWIDESQILNKFTNVKTSFFVFLPSNVTDYPDNQPNKFRVRLPKALNFNGSWVCGLHSISYPYSWSTIGTLDEQWIDIHFTDIGVAEEDKHRIVRVPVPRSSQNRVEQLRDFLTTTLRNHVNAKLKPLPREEEADPKRARRDLKLSSPPRYEKALAKPLDSPPKHVQTPAKPLDSPPRYEKAPAKQLDSPPRHEQVPKQPLDSPPLYDESKKQKPQKSPEKPATTKPPTPPASTPPPIPKPVAPAVVPKLSQPIAPVAKQPSTPTTKPVATPTSTQTLSPPSPPPAIIPSPPRAKTPPPPPAKTPPPSTAKTPPPPPTKTPPPPPAKTTSPPHPAKTASPPPPAKTASPPTVKTTSPPPAKTASPPPAKTASPPPPAAKQPSPVKTTPASKIKPAKTVTPPPTKQKTPSKPSVSPILESPPRDDESNRTIVKPSPPRLEEANKTIAKPTTFDTKEVMPTEPLAAALTQLADLPENILSIRINPLPVVPRSVSIQYLDDVERFKVSFNAGLIRHLSFSPQLGYVLGFENPQHVMSNEVAKYPVDLRGGISSFAVYSKGLTENMIVGNSLSSLLRVVSVSGATPGDYNEKIYDSPIFARVLPREINEIEIELRTMDKGRLVPFAYCYDEYVQYGSGIQDEHYFIGSSPFQRGYGGVQRGAGVGDVFRGLWRFFLPILRRVGTTVGSEALSTGQRVLERVGNDGNAS